MTYSGLLSGLQRCQKRLETRPYCIDTYISIARKYSCLGYPDLAAGAAYKALLLADAVCDAADDYHDLALDDVLDRHERPTDVSEQTYAEDIVTSKYLLPMLVCLRPVTVYCIAVSDFSLF